MSKKRIYESPTLAVDIPLDTETGLLAGSQGAAIEPSLTIDGQTVEYDTITYFEEDWY